MTMQLVRKWNNEVKKRAPKTIVCRKLDERPRHNPSDPSDVSPPYCLSGAFNGWKGVYEDGELHWKKTPNYAVGIDWDGYCEIPDTQFNREKLKVETQPKTYTRKIIPRGCEYDPEKEMFFDKIEQKWKKPLVEERTDPPQFEILGEEHRREYDPASPYFDMMRPWAGIFFQSVSGMALPNEVGGVTRMNRRT